MVVADEELRVLAALLMKRNDIDAQIAQLIERPMTSGHLGEYIAAKIFDIALETSAAAPAIDGRFRSGPPVGKTVNVKWYLKQEGVLDVSLSDALDYYLVLTGPRSAAASSKGGIRPWRIDAVYLFDSKDLVADLTSRGVKVGVATGVRNSQWEAAEIYPASATSALPVSARQSAQLALFGP